MFWKQRGLCTSASGLDTENHNVGAYVTFCIFIFMESQHVVVSLHRVMPSELVLSKDFCRYAPTKETSRFGRIHSYLQELQRKSSYFLWKRLFFNSVLNKSLGIRKQCICLNAAKHRWDWVLNLVQSHRIWEDSGSNS